MSTSQLNSEIELIKNTPSDVLHKNHLKVVFKVYQSLFGEVCTGCPTKIAGYINRIKKHKKSHKMENPKQNFRLKKGVIIPVPGTSKVYSNANLTDEISIKLLKKNPNRKALFAVIPKDYAAAEIEVVSDGPATHVKIVGRDCTVEEAVEILKAAGINTRAKTVDGVQKKVDALTEDEKAKLFDIKKPVDTKKQVITEEG